MNILYKNLFTALLLILSISSIFQGCKKSDNDPLPENNPIDTIKPKSYFPVFPGSWWYYCINDTNYITDSVSKEYQLHKYPNLYNDDLDTAFSDIVYVPFLNTVPIYGYFKIEWVMPPFGDFYTQWPILSETLGFEFEREWTDKRFGDFAEHLRIAKKIQRDNDSIIVVKGNWGRGSRQGYKDNLISIQEYTKNVGLSKHLIIDTLQQDTIYSKILHEYKINK